MTYMYFNDKKGEAYIDLSTPVESRTCMLCDNQEDEEMW